MSEAPPPSGFAGYPRALLVYVGGLVALAVALSTSLLLSQPLIFDLPLCAGILVAGIVLHTLNQLHFTIRFSGQKDNIELTFSEAGIVALFCVFPPGLVAVLSGATHVIRELQAHRRTRVTLVFNIAEIMVSVSLAGWVYQAILTKTAGHGMVAAMVCAMLTHSVSNRLLVGTVVSLNAGGFQARYFRSLFVENLVMLVANMALGMTAVLALLVNPVLLWVPVTTLAVVYLGYQAYVGQLRDANTLARLYQNALVAKVQNEATLIPFALARGLDTFGSLEITLSMQLEPGRLRQWRLERFQQQPAITTSSRELASLPGAAAPRLMEPPEPAAFWAWRPRARYSAMAAPVVYEGKLIGVLNASKPRAWDSFTHGDLRAFSLFAGQLGVSIENARLMELDREQQKLRQQALDAERNRISRDLHDSFVQTLVQVDLHLQYLQGLIEKRPEAVPAEIDDLQKNVQEGLADARSYMAELRPLHIPPGQFLAVAQRYLDDFGRQHRLHTTMRAELFDPEPPGDDLSELFQIIREALNNVAKHAKATQVILALNGDDHRLVARVTDDGVGFDVAKQLGQTRAGHFGLSNIAERAAGLGGSAVWTSAPREGTQLTVTLPRPNGAAPEGGNG